MRVCSINGIMNKSNKIFRREPNYFHLETPNMYPYEAPYTVNRLVKKTEIIINLISMPHIIFLLF